MWTKNKAVTILRVWENTIINMAMCTALRPPVCGIDSGLNTMIEINKYVFAFTDNMTFSRLSVFPLPRPGVSTSNLVKDVRYLFIEINF